ncbi:MAG: CPBP family intramembrane glutamic endopeptidase [Woeseia sp.]
MEFRPLPAAVAMRGTDAVDLPPVRALDVILVVLVATACLLLVGWLVRDMATTPALVVGLLTLQSVVVLAAVHFIVVRGRGIGWGRLGLRAAPPRWHFAAALTALVAVPMVALLNLAMQWLMQWLADAPFRNPQIEFLAPAGFSWTAFAGMLFAAAIVGPIAEEVVFRGLLYSWLRRYLGAVASIPLSAAVFAAAHGIAMLVPALLVNGVLLALLFERSRSLVPPIIAHGLFNAMMVIALYAVLAAGFIP